MAKPFYPRSPDALTLWCPLSRSFKIDPEFPVRLVIGWRESSTTVVRRSLRREKLSEGDAVYDAFLVEIKARGNGAGAR
jgi:hypothetical protein